MALLKRLLIATGVLALSIGAIGAALQPANGSSLWAWLFAVGLLAVVLWFGMGIVAETWRR